jgi:hypothetical protein
MANEINVCLGEAGLSLVAILSNENRLSRWNGSAMVAKSGVAVAAWATGAIALSEILTATVGTGDYSGTIPEGLLTTLLNIEIYKSADVATFAGGGVVPTAIGYQFWPGYASSAAANTKADVAAAVHDADLGDHDTAGTFGKAIADTLADTNEVQAELADGTGRLDVAIDQIASDVAGLDGDAMTPALTDYQQRGVAVTLPTLPDVTLAATQPNYAPAKAGDEMSLPTTAPAGYGGSTNASDYTGAFSAGVLANVPTSAGTGARIITVSVTDGTNAVEGARVRFVNGVESSVGSTNAVGVVALSVDDKTWSVSITKPGYTFTPTSLVVSADASVPYALTAVVIAASDPTLVTGYLYCYDEEGEPEAGVIVQVRAKSYAGYGVAYDTKIRPEVSNAVGLVSFTNMKPGATYQIRRGEEGDWDDVTLPTTATDPYSLPNVFGEDG